VPRLRPLPVLVAIGAFALIVRVACLPAVSESNLTPDGARFLNIARCITRGEGFSTPEAWPAWMAPERLPMPETFKEPGYPFAIAALAALGVPLFAAGQWISLLAGLLLPFVVYALGRRLHADPWVALAAAALTTACPVLIAQSAYVMAESLFALLVTTAFLAAAPRLAGEGPEAGRAFAPPRSAQALDFAAGAILGLAFLVRAQAALAAPALLLLLAAGTTPRVRVARVLFAGVGALAAVAPFLARNVRLFGAPLHSDVTAFGLWPYVDTFTLVHSPDRPPDATRYALAHLGDVTRVVVHGARRFAIETLPHDLLGHWVFLVPLALGAAIAGARARVWGFAWAFLVTTLAFILGLNWIARYFASLAPVLALLVALGAVSLARSWSSSESARGVRPSRVLGLVFALLLAAVAVRSVRHVAPPPDRERDAARNEAAFLDAHLTADEAVMGETTSYWAYYADRFAVYPLVADSVRFADTVRRLRVRWAALPTSRLAEFASRYPGGRLPAALRVDHSDPARDVTVFAVVP